MKNCLGMGLAVLLTFTSFSSPAQADPSLYRVGASNVGGQTVNSYSNAGAADYHRTMRSGQGNTIYNLAPPPDIRPKPQPRNLPLSIPSTVTYSASPKKVLDPRWVQNGSQTFDLSPIVVEEAKRFNLDPLLLEEVIRQESNFRPTAVSPVGAQGLMQLMPGTASLMGVRNAFEPKENVAGGARYLAEQLSRFQRLDLALAAYNAGPGAVSSYGGIPPYRETINYVSKIVNAYNNRVQQERSKSGEKA